MIINQKKGIIEMKKHHSGHHAKVHHHLEKAMVALEKASHHAMKHEGKKEHHKKEHHKKEHHAKKKK